MIAVRKSTLDQSQSSLPEFTTSSAVVASRGSLIVADVLVIAVTWWRLLRQASLRNVFLMRGRVTLMDVLLRDGKPPI